MDITEFSADNAASLSLKGDNLKILRAYHKDGKVVEVQFGLSSELKKYAIPNIRWCDIERVEVYRYFFQDDGPFKKGFYLEHKDFTSQFRELQKNFIKETRRISEKKKRKDEEVVVNDVSHLPCYVESTIKFPIPKGVRSLKEKEVYSFKGPFEILGRRTGERFELHGASIDVVHRTLDELIVFAEQLGANLICKGLIYKGAYKERKGFYYFAKVDTMSLTPELEKFLVSNLKKP